MRGCQKRVIYLKNTGSEFFDEAYFVLKSDTDMALRTEGDIIREANRIIDENIGNRKRIDFKRIIPIVTAFLLGAVISVLIF